MNFLSRLQFQDHGRHHSTDNATADEEVIDIYNRVTFPATTSFFWGQWASVRCPETLPLVH